MPKVWELLDRAHMCKESGDKGSAQNLIEEALSHDLQNIVAWEAYIDTLNTQPELERLKDMVHFIWASHVRDQDFLNANKRYLLRRLDERMNSL
ncbi:MAG: hypothetical protein MUO77_03230 [Anaerolineales bacterium]|nr:hypothetical protein [Anaerolineales bacterium]